MKIRDNNGKDVDYVSSIIKIRPKSMNAHVTELHSYVVGLVYSLNVPHRKMTFSGWQIKHF